MKDEALMLVEAYFVECQDTAHLPDGAQMWDGKWWVPRWGCDTLGEIVDEIFIPFLTMCIDEADRPIKPDASTDSSPALPTD